MKDSRIPGEIVDFFGGEPGKTLLIKGAPGGGKTIFAFTLLREVERRGVYLSTRVDVQSLYSQIGWLKEGLPPENIIDATQSERQSMPGMPAIRALKYTDVPDFLKGVYQRTEKLEHPLVIIDSWDAVVSHTGFYEPRERERLEHNLCDFSRKTATDIIFLAEYIEQKPLDYLTDAVVILESSIYDERRLRTMVLSKLRGHAIRQPSYLFTLDDGIFRAFPTFKGCLLDNLIRLPAISDISQGRVSTGIRDLDSIVGGYGSFNLCRGDRTAYNLLLLPFILNSLGLGKRLVLPLSEQALIKNMAPLVFNHMAKNMKTLPIAAYNDLAKNISELTADASDAGWVCLLNLDDLVEAEYGRAADMISEVMEKGGVVFSFASEGKPIPAELESIGCTSLVTKMFHGVPCVYGRLPMTEVYAMEMGTGADLFEASLTPIV